MLEAIRLAIHSVVELNARQMEAVMIGDCATLESIQRELKGVNGRKESLLAAYSNHLREHGC